MATNNAVNTSLSGQTGTGNFVGATSPTLVTPTLGAATATSLAFSPTTGGIIGTTAADSATAGDVGEVITAQILYAARTSITTATPTNLFTISLTAGDWDLWGNAGVNSTVAITNVYAGFSSTSATLPDFTFTNLNPATSSVYNDVVPMIRVNVSTTTSYYLVINSTFTGTGTMFGYYIARRRR